MKPDVSGERSIRLIPLQTAAFRPPKEWIATVGAAGECAIQLGDDRVTFARAALEMLVVDCFVPAKGSGYHALSVVCGGESKSLLFHSGFEAEIDDWMRATASTLGEFFGVSVRVIAGADA